MNVFKDYAEYYDLLYKNKDYSAEAQEIISLIKEYLPKTKAVLNLGCGTGSHDILLAQSGLDVTGVDQSEDMIAIAKEKAKGEKNLNFLVGDVRNVSLERKFNVIVSLFHVISYQITNDDLKNMFATVDSHLDENGVFIFDCWYGPGVLTDLPVVRHKVLENEKIRVHRIADPVMHFDENYVDVNYTILVTNKESKESYEIAETHKMRYLFSRELEQLASCFNMEIVQKKNNSFSNSWNALFLASRKH